MIDGMDSEQEWMASIVAPKTKENYKRGWAIFKSYMNMDAEAILETRKQDGRKRFETRVKMFWEWLQKERKVSENTARTYCVPIESFCAYYDVPLRLSKILPPIGPKMEDYYPTVEDLQAQYRYNDLETKAWLSLARDCPARIGDLLKVSPEDIAKGEKMIMSQKEKVAGWLFFSDQTRELFSKNPQIPRTNRGIAKLLQRASEVAKVHAWNPHLFRKFFITIATNLQLNEWVVKTLAFKTVGQSDSNYYFRIHDELKKSWEKVINAIPLELKNGRITDLEKRIDLVVKALKKDYKAMHALKPNEYTIPNLQIDEMCEDEFLEMYVGKEGVEIAREKGKGERRV